MRLRFTTTADLEGTPAAARAALADPAVWPALLPGLERLGHYWRYRGELYEIACVSEGTRLRWDAVAAADPRSRIRADLLLQATPLGCGATLTLTLAVATTFEARLRRPLLRRHLERAAQAIAVRLGLLQPPEPADLARRYPRTLAAFEEMGALEHLERIAYLDAVWAEIRNQADQRPTTNDQRLTADEGQRTRGEGPTTKNQRPEAYVSQSQHESVYQVVRADDPLLGSQCSVLNFDLIYAGGGLGLLHAAVMARRYGYRVLLFDRGEVGCAHREWNISRGELGALVELGLCDWAELEPVVMAEYRGGVVRFHTGAGRASAELWLDGVLDLALDAGALLRLARRKLEQAGGTVLDGRSFRRVSVAESGPARVLVELGRVDGSAERYGARLLLDGMGSTSPLALRRFAGQPFAGVCPTVGTVVAGLQQGPARDQHNPQVGDILLTVADAQRGQQYMWEGFPGRGDELTVYLFYYDTLGQARRGAAPVGLIQLFEDYFALLPTYKRPGPDLRHLKPVYGYIPARHSLRRQEAPLLRGVLPIGDSAAQQSPLTFCGFGSHVRNLGRTTELLDEALRGGLTEPRHLRLVSPFQVNVSLNWVFSRFMQPWQSGRDVNLLQHVFLTVLNDLGHDLAQRFFRDQMRWGDYHRMVLGVFFRHPAVVLAAWRVLGAQGVRRWAADYLVYSGEATLAALGRRAGARARVGLVGLAARYAPGLALRLRARFAEWQAMGWDR
jgi:lycopene cyclase CruA